MKMKLIKTFAILSLMVFTSCASMEMKLDRMPGGRAVAFDYDGTCKATPDLCVALFRVVLEEGLQPIILTARAKWTDGLDRYQDMAKFALAASVRLGATIPIIYAGGRPKSEAALAEGHSPFAICDDRSVTPDIAKAGASANVIILYVCGSSVPAPSWLEKLQQLF